MKEKFTALKAWVDKHVPAQARKETTHIALVFVVTFVATAAPALPSLIGTSQLPSFTAVHAVIASATAAALRATIPVARVAVVALAVKIASHESAKKAAAQAALVASVIASIEQSKSGTATPVVTNTPLPASSIPGPEIK